MPPRRTKLKIPGMYAQGPPSYSELETNDRRQLRREAAYCIHYSSLREILTSQDLADWIAKETQQAIVAELDEEQATVVHARRLAARMEQRIQNTIARVQEG